MTIINDYFASTSSSSWEYAGRFCFRPNVAEYESKSQIKVSVQHAIRNIPLFLAIYWDDPTSQRICDERLTCYESNYANDKWYNIYNGIPSNPLSSPSCGWRLAVANARGNLIDLRSLYPPVDVQTPSDVQKPNATTMKIDFWGDRTREYHFAVAACYPDQVCVNPPCEYALQQVQLEMIMVNSFADTTYVHLSSDDYDIMNSCTWAFALSIILALSTCKSIFAHFHFGTMHWLNILLFSSQCFTMASYGLAAMYLSDMGSTGTGRQSARAFIAVVHTSGQTLLLLTTLLYTKGWLFGREKISARGRVFITVVVTVFACFSTALSLSSSAGLVVVPNKLPLRIAPFAGTNGGLLVGLRFCVAVWMIFVISTTIKRNPESHVARIGFFGIVWLIVPCAVNAIVVDQEACSERPLVIATEAICTLVLLLGLELALWPYSSSVLILRGRSSVVKSNAQLSQCIRTGGFTCIRTCCFPNTFVWVAGKKPLSEQSKLIKGQISAMYRQVISLTEILKQMRNEEGGHQGERKKASQRQQFGGGIGTMEDVMNGNTNDGANLADVWETIPSNHTSEMGGENMHTSSTAERAVQRREFVLPPVKSTL